MSVTLLPVDDVDKRQHKSAWPVLSPYLAVNTGLIKAASYSAVCTCEHMAGIVYQFSCVSFVHEDSEKLSPQEVKSKLTLQSGSHGNV